MTREEALQAIKEKMDYYESDKRLRGAIETLVPELAESEDERIIKLIRSLLENVRNVQSNTSLYKQYDDALAWLEKQKEQKPDIELIQRSWYMEGYHDREFGKEPKWIIKTGEGGPKHELNPRYGQPLTEQQVTEEQLHNLNEAIKSFRMDGFDKIADSLHSLYNILNTQEQKPVDLSEMMVHKEPYIAPVPTPMVADEQKPAEWNEEDEEMINMLVDYVEYPSCWNLKCPREKLVAFIKSLPKRFSPQPKQEWSKEDEEMIDDIIGALPKMAEAEDNILPEILPSVARKYAERLKSLRPQYHGDVTMTEAYKMGLEAGKASSWKPSEHQMTILKAVKDYVGKGSGYWGEALGSLIEDLEKL